MKKRYWIGTGIATVLLLVVAVIIAYFKSNEPEVYQKNEAAFNVVVWCIVGLWAVWQALNGIFSIVKHKRKNRYDVRNK